MRTTDSSLGLKLEVSNAGNWVGFKMRLGSTETDRLTDAQIEAVYAGAAKLAAQPGAVTA